MRTTNHKTNKNNKQRGFMDPISLGFLGAIVVFHLVVAVVTVPDLSSGVRSGEPLPTLPTIP